MWESRGNVPYIGALDLMTSWMQGTRKRTRRQKSDFEYGGETEMKRK